MLDQPCHEDTQLTNDALALFVDEIEDAIRQEQFHEAEKLIEENAAAAWFGLPPARTGEIVELLAHKLPVPGFVISAGAKLLAAADTGRLDSQDYLSTIDSGDNRQLFLLSMLRMSAIRIRGYVSEAYEQAENALRYVQKTRSAVDLQDGWVLQTLVQVGVSAMLAGDFTAALTAFTQAQLHTPVPKFAFLTRDALIKSALLHACFGNITSAKALLQRAEHIPRTSSWVEVQLDVHRDFTEILTHLDDPEHALAQLETIDLHDIGEMWPFYIVALHRVLEVGGYHEELQHRLEIFDALPLPRIDGDGFAGSIIPLKRALLSLRSHRMAEAQELLDRADPQVHYTQLIQAAADVYSARPRQALRAAEQLHGPMRGFRLLELRRLAVLAAAQYHSADRAAALKTLQLAAKIPQGLLPVEAKFFSPETRTLASQHIASWPPDTDASSLFLTGLPKMELNLTERELEIVEQLASGYSRSQIAQNLFVSVNTIKTQLQSLYRKLDVSSAPEAVLNAQRRGLI